MQNEELTNLFPTIADIRQLVKSLYVQYFLHETVGKFSSYKPVAATGLKIVSVHQDERVIIKSEVADL